MNVSTEIQSILEKNKLEDLKEFIGKRKCLNSCNLALIYLFHIIQSAGILTTTVAAGYNFKELIWVGVGLNIIATIINAFEKTNSSVSKGLLKDINAIRDGTYVDESALEMPEMKKDDKGAPLLSQEKV
jgi:GTP:adenosylcobinamide-phosphate guanylyltransferase